MDPTKAAQIAAQSTPAGMAVSTGSQFLQNYLAQQAAREKEKREAQAKAAEQELAAMNQQVNNQQGAFKEMMGSYGRVFT